MSPPPDDGDAPSDDDGPDEVTPADDPADSSPSDSRDNAADGAHDASADGPGDSSAETPRDSPSETARDASRESRRDPSDRPSDASGRDGDPRIGASNGGRPTAVNRGSEAHREQPETDDDEVEWTTFVYDLVSSVTAVLLVGALLFAVSGVWPPMVAIESPSMDPHMKAGDLVFVMDEDRFPGEGAHAGTGVVSAHAGADADYRKFQQPGDVIVYHPNGNEDRTPIIHRAMFWVEEGENWYDEANQSYVRADDCEDMSNCDAPHAGFITKGDANPTYDQVGDSLSEPVKPEWIVGTAQVRVPWLGCIRLKTSGQEGVCELQTTAAGATPIATGDGTNATVGAGY